MSRAVKFSRMCLSFLVPVILVCSMLLIPATSVTADTTVILSGTVRDNQMTPLAGAEIQALNAGTQQVVMSASSDAGGFYTMSIPPGTYDVIATPPAGSGFQTSNIPGVTVLTDRTLDITFVPAAAAITYSGVVKNAAGTGVYGQGVSLNSNVGGTSSNTHTDNQGSFHMAVLPGDFRVAINSSEDHAGVPQEYNLYGPCNSLTDATVVPLSLHQDTNHTITLPTINVTFRVIDPAGNPVPGTSIYADSGYHLGLYNVGPYILTGWVHSYRNTGPDGTDTEVLFPARYDIVATPPSGTPFAVTTMNNVDISDGAVITIQFTQPVTYSAVVKNAAGAVVPGLQVDLSPAAGGPSTYSTTNSQGSFSMVVLPGNYRVIFHGMYVDNMNGPQASLTDDTFVPLSLTQDTSHIITLPTINVTFRVIDPAGNPVPDTLIYALSSQSPGGLYNVGPYILAGSAGCYTNTGPDGTLAQVLFPTRYIITATPPSSTHLAAKTMYNVDIADGAVITIQLPQAITYSGVMKNAAGAVVSGQDVRLTPTAAGNGGYSPTNSQGSFSMSVLPGDYSVFILGNGADGLLPDYFSMSGPLSSLTDDTFLPLSLSQNTNHTITIPTINATFRVIDPAGNPVPGTSISSQSYRGLYNVGPYILSGSSTSYCRTGTDGNITDVIFPARYTLTATPPSGSPLASFNLNNVDISQDGQIEVIVLQFVHPPPVTTATVAPPPDAQGNYTDPATVTLSATAASGFTIAATYYTLDGGAQQTYSAPFTVSGVGAHTISYWSVDNIGVTETPQTLSLQIGTLPKPDLVIIEKHEQWIDQNAGTYQVYFTVKNTGTSDVTTAFNIGVSIDGAVQPEKVSIASLAANATAAGSFTTTFPVSGASDQIVVTADADSAVNELDEANNSLTNTWNAPPDTTLPTVINTTPANNAPNVPISTTIDATFSEAMKQTETQAAFSINPPVLGAFSWAGNVLTFDPAADLAYSTLYNITIGTGAQDLAGNPLDGNANGIPQGSPADDYQFSFTTTTTGPTAYTLNISVNGQGIVMPPVGTYTYPSGMVVNVTATPAAGWQFANWTGDVADVNAASTTVTMNADKTATANFILTTSKPDLIISEKHEQWVNQNTGTYQVYFTVKNAGTVDATTAFNIGVSIDGAAQPEKVGIASLAANTTAGGSFINTFTVSGDSDTVMVTADIDVQVDDSNRQNNSLTNIWNAPAPVTGSISGYVYQADGVTPIPGASVTAELITGGSPGSTTTGAAGSYVISGLTPGSYRVHANCAGYAIEYYNNVPVATSATPVAVTAETDTPNINFTLDTVLLTDLIISEKHEEWVNQNAGTYWLYFTVKNIGMAIAPSGHKVGVSIDGIAQAESSTIGMELAPNATAAGRFITAFTMSGASDQVVVTADVDNAVNETDETNNSLTNTWNAPASDTTPPTITNVVPANNAVQVVTNTMIGVTFSEAMNQASAHNAFSINPTVFGTFSWTGNVMTFDPIAELANNTTYGVTIGTGAQDLAGNQMVAPYTFSFITATGATVPAVPTNLAATAVSPTQIDLTWTDNSNNETGFRLERALDPVFIIGMTSFSLPSDCVSFSDTSVSPGTAYYYRVCAYNAVGDSPFSNIASATTPTATVPPVVVTNAATDVATLHGQLTSLGSASTVLVSFQFGTRPGIYTTETSPNPMQAPGTFSFQMGGLTPGTTYYFRARGVGDGTSYGAEMSFTTPGPLQFNVIRSLPATVPPGQTFDVTITFNAPVDQFNASGLTDFAPDGWTVAVNDAWCIPAAYGSLAINNRAQYIFPSLVYPQGQAFTAVYKVTVPAGAAPGLYSFTNGTLEYYVGGSGPYFAPVTGANQVQVAPVVTLQSIAVSPINQSIPIGGIVQFIATGTFADGSTADITNTVMWTSSNMIVANILPPGMANGITPGQTTITATRGVISGSTTLTVTAPIPLQSIAVTPINLSIPIGGIVQFIATGTFADGSTADITNTVMWTTSDPVVANILPTGMANGITPGQTTITASRGVISGSTTLTVISNQPPLADFTYSPLTPNEGSPVQFTDVSSDPNNNIISWLWNFGDGGTSTLQNPAHNYADNGSYPVILIVSNTGGLGGSKTKTLVVNNVPPTVEAGPDQPQLWGLPVSFAGTTSDPSPVDTAAGLNPVWTFGDGGTASGISASHVYANPGVYTVTLAATDKDGGVGSDTARVTINKRGTSLTITSSNTLPTGSAVVTAVLKDYAAAPVAGKAVAFSAGSISSNGTTDANGVATATIALLSGQHTLNASFAGDAYYLTSNATAQTIYVYQQSQFVIWGGNQPDLADAIKVGQSYMFWGAQWDKQVTAGDFQKNNSFKGYANQVSGLTWSSSPGNSSNPPASIGSYISVIVATHIEKNGNVVTGNIAHVVLLCVDNTSDYQPNPGHPCTGVMVSIVQ